MTAIGLKTLTTKTALLSVITDEIIDLKLCIKISKQLVNIKAQSSAYLFKFNQGSVLSPYFFSVITNEITNYILGEEKSWCKIFTDGIVLVGENLEGVNNRLDEWRLAL